MSFEIDDRHARDTLVIGDLPLSRLLLMNDARWPWLILVPRREGMVELTDLEPPDRTQLTDEADRAARFLKSHARADKINAGALATSSVSSTCILSRGLLAIRLSLGQYGGMARRRLMSPPPRGCSLRRQRKILGSRQKKTGLRRTLETMIRLVCHPARKG